MQNNINQTLLEVRKAYRLLYSYQKRILDLVSYIGGKYGLRYNGGYAKFSSPAPKNGKGALNLWSWDWLNLYYYEFHFENIKIGEDQIYFSIFIVNDTGYFEANLESSIDKTSIRKFKAVENSKSELILVVGKNLWEGWGYWWDEPEFILEPYGEKIKENNRIMVFKHYALEDFENEEKTLYNLKDFESICKSKNINFKIKINMFEI